MQRLYSGFPDGWPGMSILFLRLGAGILLIHDGIAELLGASASIPMIGELIGVGTGVLLLAGLWTPISGTLAAILELWIAFTRIDDLRSALLLATLGVALAMLGPGAWSVDARLFGWKRIEIPEKKAPNPPF